MLHDIIDTKETGSGVLGFRKGGAKFSLATSAHTKEGANQVFQFFFNVKKGFFLAKGGAMTQWPPKYAPGNRSSELIKPRSLIMTMTVTSSRWSRNLKLLSNYQGLIFVRLGYSWEWLIISALQWRDFKDVKSPRTRRIILPNPTNILPIRAFPTNTWITRSAFQFLPIPSINFHPPHKFL